MCTSERRTRSLRAVLEDEVVRFRSLYPKSTARFAEIIGKRVSHVAGPVDTLHVDERRVPVSDRLVMLVDDNDGIGAEDLERFAARVAAVLDHRGKA